MAMHTAKKRYFSKPPSIFSSICKMVSGRFSSRRMLHRIFECMGKAYAKGDFWRLKIFKEKDRKISEQRAKSIHEESLLEPTRNLVMITFKD